MSAFQSTAEGKLFTHTSEGISQSLDKISTSTMPDGVFVWCTVLSLAVTTSTEVFPSYLQRRGGNISMRRMQPFLQTSGTNKVLVFLSLMDSQNRRSFWWKFIIRFFFISVTRSCYFSEWKSITEESAFKREKDVQRLFITIK